MTVRLLSVCFSHVPGRPLLDRASAAFGPGFTGLVGANGAGKSTLLRLISGELEPDSGRVERRGLSVSRLDQRLPDRASPDVIAFARDAGPAAARLRAALGIAAADVDRFARLSPGVRRRFTLGATLLTAPDVLLLDEPTNHLDAEARAALLAALRDYRGIALVVSHDRALLEALCPRTAWLDAGHLELHAAPYAVARERRQAARQAAARVQDDLQREHRRLRRALAGRRQVRAEAERGRSARRATDPDSRSMGQRNRAAWAEARAGREVAALAERVDAAARRLAGQRIARERGGTIAWRGAPPAKSRLVAFAGDLPRADGTGVLARDLSLVVLRDTRARLCGPNGAGKSTLLAALAAAWTGPAERLLHLPQELPPQAARTIVDRLRQSPPRERGEALAIAASLGLDPDAVMASECPSPGEARQLALAQALARDVALLLLDEPTNDLDLPATERLEAALAAWTGPLVLVTHDDGLARACASIDWTPFAS